MKHALQYNFIALFIQGWITTDYSCFANTILNKLQPSTSMGVWEEVRENGADERGKTNCVHYAEG